MLKKFHNIWTKMFDCHIYHIYATVMIMIISVQVTQEF